MDKEGCVLFGGVGRHNYFAVGIDAAVQVVMVEVFPHLAMYCLLAVLLSHYWQST